MCLNILIVQNLKTGQNVIQVATDISDMCYLSINKNIERGDAQKT